MRVFVTGATGLIGRALIPQLLARGHEVIALARNDASRVMLHAMRVTPLAGQGHDIAQLTSALASADAVVHLAATIPSQDSAVEDDWVHSDEVMVGLLRNLITAGAQAGVRGILFPSSYAVYGDHGEEWVTEETLTAPSDLFEPYTRAEALLHRAYETHGLKVVVLRLGLLYSADAQHTRGLLYGLKRGQVPIMGNGSMFWPLLHADDAAMAMCLALEQALSQGAVLFNVCDNEPVRSGQLYYDLARWLEGPPPQRRTGQRADDFNPYQGQVKIAALRASVRLSNRKIRERLGFTPQYPTYREGFRAVLDAVAQAL